VVSGFLLKTSYDIIRSETAAAHPRSKLRGIQGAAA